MPALERNPCPDLLGTELRPGHFHRLAGPLQPIQDQPGGNRALFSRDPSTAGAPTRWLSWAMATGWSTLPCRRTDHPSNASSSVATSGSTVPTQGDAWRSAPPGRPTSRSRPALHRYFRPHGNPLAGATNVNIHLGFDPVWSESPCPAYDQRRRLRSGNMPPIVPTNYTISVNWVLNGLLQRLPVFWYSPADWRAFMVPFVIPDPRRSVPCAEKSAFTLIELLVVIAILGILARFSSRVLEGHRDGPAVQMRQQPKDHRLGLLCLRHRQ